MALLKGNIALTHSFSQVNDIALCIDTLALPSNSMLFNDNCLILTQAFDLIYD